MSNKIYRQFLIDRIDTFLRESKSANLLTHFGLRGEIRESGLGKLILDILPIDWGIGNGKIIDSEDNQSSQTDLIIYYKRVFPPMFFEGTKGVFPLESCGFAFEIKTKSTKQQLRSTIESFNKLKGMQIIKPWSGASPEYRIKPIRVYFAIDSDLEKKDELERYKSLDEDHELDPAIQIICIVGKGTWFYRDKTRYTDEPDTYWEFYPNKGNHEELLVFFGVIINQITSIVTHGALDLKRYLFELFEEFEWKKTIR